MGGAGKRSLTIKTDWLRAVRREWKPGSYACVGKGQCKTKNQQQLPDIIEPRDKWESLGRNE
jgi:hypothetical protein